VQFIETIKEPDLEWRFTTPGGAILTLYEILLHVNEDEI